MADAELSDPLFPSLPDGFFEGELMNWRFASEDSNYLFKPSSSTPGNAVNADKIGAKCEDGILHITLSNGASIQPKPAKEMNILSI